jgi:hypothetical protein
MHLGSPKSPQEVGGDPGASKPKTCRIFKKQPLQQADFVDPKAADLGNVSGFFEQLTKPNNVEKTVAKVHLSPMQTGQGAGQRASKSPIQKDVAGGRAIRSPHFCVVNTHLFDIGFRPTEFSQILILVWS